MWIGMEMSCLLSDILGTDEDTIYRDMEHGSRKESCCLRCNQPAERKGTDDHTNCDSDWNDPNGEEKTQKEVADILGISQSYISRLEKKIMQRLKKEMLKYS